MDEEEREEIVSAYSKAKLGQVGPCELPEGYDLLLSLPPLPQNATYVVESLPVGINLGREWKREEEIFSSDLLARAKAWDITNILGNMSRVLLAGKKEMIPIVVFYKRDEKVYISIRTETGETLEQSVESEYDTVGGVIHVTYEKGNLTTEKIK